MFLKLKIAKILKSDRRGLENCELPWEHIFFISIGVLSVELLAYQVSMVPAAKLV